MSVLGISNLFGDKNQKISSQKETLISKLQTGVSLSTFASLSFLATYFHKTKEFWGLASEGPQINSREILDLLPEKSLDLVEQILIDQKVSLIDGNLTLHNSKTLHILTPNVFQIITYAINHPNLGAFLYPSDPPFLKNSTILSESVGPHLALTFADWPLLILLTTLVRDIKTLDALDVANWELKEMSDQAEKGVN